VLVPWLAALPLILAGCANFWDDVTSKDFDYKKILSRPNPFQVLKDSQDGDDRARAYRALREPKRFGGTGQDQDAVVKILVTGASTERQFLCRMAAIEALGHFQDPRAVPGLTDAFYNSTTFPPELATRVQCQALAALGETGSTEAEKFLVKVVKGAPGDGSEQDKQQVMDVRIAAARALGHFKGQQTNEALVRVLQSDKDIALRDSARDSLSASLGRPLPAEMKDWDVVLHPEKAVPGELVQAPSRFSEILQLKWVPDLWPF
jgi:hypothetical protein